MADSKVEKEKPSDAFLFHEGEPGKEVDYYLAQEPATITAAKQLRHEVYLECGFIEKPFPEKVIPDHQDNDEALYLVAKVDGEVIGTIRMAAPPFKTIEVLGDEVYDAAREELKDLAKSNAVELGSLAVKHKSGRSHISGTLYKAVYWVSLQQKIKYWVIDIDERVYDALLRLGWKVDEIGPRHEYMGSETVPGIMPVEEQADHIMSKNPKYFEYLMQ